MPSLQCGEAVKEMFGKIQAKLEITTEKEMMDCLKGNDAALFDMVRSSPAYQDSAQRAAELFLQLPHEERQKIIRHIRNKLTWAQKNKEFKEAEERYAGTYEPPDLEDDSHLCAICGRGHSPNMECGRVPRGN